MNATTTVADLLKHSAPAAPSTLKAHVYTILRNAIVSGRYKPGSRLNESQLAREFNISRIPIREALMQLQEHGLVMNHERRGMFVTELADEDVQRINSVRIVLEAEAIKLARARMTPAIAAHLTALVDQMETLGDSSEMDSAALDLEFHRTIWEAAGNPYLSRTLDTLSTVLFAHTALENASTETSRWRLNHHRDLLNVAIGKSDKPVEQAVMEHLSVHYSDPGRFSSYWQDAPRTKSRRT
jgi:DNA-binding GntR family transcriptional regulator